VAYRQRSLGIRYLRGRDRLTPAGRGRTMYVLRRFSGDYGASGAFLHSKGGTRTRMYGSVPLIFSVRQLGTSHNNQINLHF
jgi:hypothetical protein